MNYYIPAKEENIRIIGRTPKQDPLPLFWTASGVEFETDGTELWFEFETDYNSNEEWIRVEVNGFTMIRMPLPKGNSKVSVYRGFASDSPKRIRLFKEVQAMGGDTAAKLLLKGIETDGSLLPLKPRSCKIEFIGDSITSGEGMAGSTDTFTWISAIFSTKDHYAVETAKAMDAEMSILSQSGWGTYCSYDNQPQNVLPRIYSKVCGVLDGTVNKEYGCSADHDFTSWQPDAIIINLGTNDYAAFSNPAYVNEVGETFKQELKADGTPEEASKNRFSKAVIDFLADIRSKNPKAQLLWVYGMLGDPMWPYLKEAVDTYCKQSGDDKASAMLLPDTVEGGFGANGHPGAGSHAATAKVLVEKLKSLGIGQE